MKNLSKQITVSGLMIATGLILPIAFHTFAMGGPVFLPMHIPVLLGGFLLTPLFAVLVGVVTPLISSVLTGMPPLFPTGIQMVFELAAYGFVVSFLYHRSKLSIYPALIIAMLAGRTASGIVSYLLLTQFLTQAFNLKVFLTASFITSIPGMIIQLVMIPIMIKLLERADVFHRGKEEIHEHRA